MSPEKNRIFKTFCDTWEYAHNFVCSRGSIMKYNKKDCCEYCGNQVHPLYSEIIRTLKSECYLEEDYKQMCCFCQKVLEEDELFFNGCIAGSVSLFFRGGIQWHYRRIENLLENNPEIFEKLLLLLGDKKNDFLIEFNKEKYLLI